MTRLPYLDSTPPPRWVFVVAVLMILAWGFVLGLLTGALIVGGF